MILITHRREVKLTTMDDTVNIIKICQALQYRQCHMADHIDINCAYLLVDSVQRPFVHKLHADANIGIGKKRAIE